MGSTANGPPDEGEGLGAAPRKRGPGRPRKHPPKDPNAPKRKPGRPRKHPLPDPNAPPKKRGPKAAPGRPKQRPPKPKFKPPAEAPADTPIVPYDTPITMLAVDRMIGASQVGVPLKIAATAAGVNPETAQEWLIHGRACIIERDRRGGGPLSDRVVDRVQDALCIKFAEHWDAGLARMYIAVQGYQVAHAKRDQNVAERLLGAVGAEFERREEIRTAKRRSKRPDLSPDILTPTYSSGAIERRRPELTAMESEFDDRSVTDCEYYAQFGRWPEEEPEGIVIEAEAETEGDSVDDIPDLAAELGSPGAAQARDESMAALPTDATGNVVVTGGEHVQDVAPAKIVGSPAPVPAYPPLRRVADPRDR